MPLDRQDQLSEREQAVLGFINLQGGWDSYFKHGGHITDLIPLLDERQGSHALKDLAALGKIGTASITELADVDREQPISPEIAKAWLLKYKLAIEENGGLTPEASTTSHFALAAIEVARGESPRLLSEVYQEVTNSDFPLTEEVTARWSKEILDEFSD